MSSWQINRSSRREPLKSASSYRDTWGCPRLSVVIRQGQVLSTLLLAFPFRVVHFGDVTINNVVTVLLQPQQSKFQEEILQISIL
jgi:hypothetical protein